MAKIVNVSVSVTYTLLIKENIKINRTECKVLSIPKYLKGLDIMIYIYGLLHHTLNFSNKQNCISINVNNFQRL